MSKSSIIKHTFTYLPRKHPYRVITEEAVLKDWNPNGWASTPLAKMCSFQWAYRGQILRMIRLEPDNARKLIYAANCYPTGFEAKPFTLFCRNSLGCPWCLVRKAVDVYKQIKEQAKIQNLNHLLCWWAKAVPIPANIPGSSGQIQLPFFRGDRGPHYWAKAGLTIQTVVPAYDINLTVRHIGFQLVQMDKEMAESIAVKYAKAGIAVESIDAKNRDLLMKTIGTYFKVPWSQLLEETCLPEFMQLRTGFKHRNLIRVSGRVTPNPEEATNGKEERT